MAGKEVELAQLNSTVLPAGPHELHVAVSRARLLAPSCGALRRDVWLGQTARKHCATEPGRPNAQAPHSCCPTLGPHWPSGSPGPALPLAAATPPSLLPYFPSCPLAHHCCYCCFSPAATSCPTIPLWLQLNLASTMWFSAI